MATHDKFVTVADGDRLDDGYFNGIKYMARANAIFCNLAAGATKEIPFSNGNLLMTETGVDTTNSQGVICTLTDTFIAGGTIYDNIDDSSLSAVKWTSDVGGTGAVSETADAIILATGAAGTAYLYSNGSSPLNMNSGTTYVLMDFTSTDGANVLFRLTNTSTHKTVYAMSGSINRRAYLLKVDAGGDLASLWDHTGVGIWRALATNIDVSTVTTNKYLRLEVGGAGSLQSELHKICYYTTDANSNIQLSAKSFATTKGTAWASGYHIKRGSTDAVYAVSLDNGANFTTVNEFAPTAIANTGTAMVLRATIKTNNNNTPDEFVYIVGQAE